MQSLYTLVTFRHSPTSCLASTTKYFIRPLSSNAQPLIFLWTFLVSRQKSAKTLAILAALLIAFPILFCVSHIRSSISSSSSHPSPKLPEFPVSGCGSCSAVTMFAALVVVRETDAWLATPVPSRSQVVDRSGSTTLELAFIPSPPTTAVHWFSKPGKVTTFSCLTSIMHFLPGHFPVRFIPNRQVWGIH